MAETVPDVVVIEPRCLGDADTARRAVILFSPSKIVAYTAIAPHLMEPLLELVRGGVRHVLILGIDDSSERLNAVCESILGDELGERFLRQIDEQLTHLPRRLAAAIVDAVRHSDKYEDVRALCVRADLHRRSCDRHFLNCGLTSLRRLITGVRVLRAFSLLKSRGDVELIAKRVGASSARHLSVEILRVTGVSLIEFRESGDDDILNAVYSYTVRHEHVRGRR